MLNFNPTKAQIELQKKARSFAIDHVLPEAWHYDIKDETPVHILKGAFTQGLSHSDIPVAYGGKGFGIIEGCVISEEISAACPGIATSIFDNSLGMKPLILSSNEALKKEYLPRFAKEFKLISFATSEPTLGSDVSAIRCMAKPDGNDYILNGTKYWVTNGGIADYYSIFATINPDTKHEGICAFFIDRKWPGVEVGQPIPKMGQRCSNTVGVHFNNVRVPKKYVLAPPGEGFLLAMNTFNSTRPVIGAFAIGAARSAFEYAMDYAKKRQAFGQKIGNNQAIQFKLADMYQKIETSRLLVLKAAWESDKGMDPTLNASISKFYATEACIEVVDEALQILGGYGYTKMFPLEKLYRDVRLLRIYEGTSEIQRMVVAGYIMGGYKPVMPSLEDIPVYHEENLCEGPSAGGEKGKIWRCRICGHTHYENDPPEVCPYCFFPGKAFKKIGESA
ncbi:acyl-CoA dehydrogenase [Desulfobacter hydrogenophilus]|uniref:Acyl-CoA dehydrogenase n=1 Tax=Desulfobacter hydrogenophilus TaxID=2291 RepID=A0A328FIP5_9BACT|nr:acyl-CoA dehydrogenase family protein [Desulfobacter hydrogenophilus]NDY70704.1 acyl-CoA dehydrogenase [Desulfobacter hydrogenophilus]QBH12683.1 acyl-CoA dehydrogenase [Desulfobacter hydrogenophilus]RAM03352.1 acyl-CoA dehydrogenase [Desulfobacter hydrogenophilus]